MARYPFHWHRSGNVNGQYIMNSSIHNSFQRCITVHATNNATVENNVCYNFRGYGYFLEDGVETGNVIKNNIGVWARLPHASKILLASDDRSQTTDLRFPATSVFWISHQCGNHRFFTVSQFLRSSTFSTTRSCCFNTCFCAFLDQFSLELCQ